MDDIRIYKGYWWRPANPEEEVAGTLAIDQRGNARLELYGCFEEEGGFNLESKDESALYGRTYAPNGHMKDISLLQCHRSFSYNFGSTFPLTRYTCRFALIGIHVDSMKDDAFFKAHVDFKELAYWCPPSNIVTFYSNDAISLKISIADNDDRVKASVTMDDETTLQLKEAVSYHPDYPKVDIEQETYLEILKEGISAWDILSLARGFERFLSIPVLRAVEHGCIVMYSRQRFQERDNDEPIYHSIELISCLYNEVEQDLSKFPDYLFKYEDVADDFGEMFKKVYTDKNIAQILSNFIDSLEKKRVFTSNDFLVVAQALDGFAMRFRKEKGVLEEYTELRDEFADIRKMKLSDDDLKAAAGSRNYYSHILKLERKEAKGAVDGVALLNLTEKLRVLLLCCVLNFLGMSNEKINDLLGKCNNRVLRY